MALTVNKDPFPYTEGLTVSDVLEEKKYTYRLKTVYVNGARIPKDQWDATVLRDGDEVKVIHLMAGG